MRKTSARAITRESAGNSLVTSPQGITVIAGAKRRRESTELGGPVDVPKPSRDVMVAALAEVGVDVGGCSLDHVQLFSLYRKNANPSKARKPNNQTLQDEIEEIEGRNGRLIVLRKPPSKRRSVNFTLQIPPLEREPARGTNSQSTEGNQDTRDDDDELSEEATILKEWCDSDPFGDQTHSAGLGSGSLVIDKSRTTRSPSPQSTAPLSPHTHNRSAPGAPPRVPDGNSDRHDSTHDLRGASTNQTSRQTSGAGDTRKDLSFLHAASGTSSDEGEDLLGPILDHRLRPRDANSRRVSKTRCASVSKKAGPSQKQKITRLSRSGTQATADDSDEDDEHVVGLSRKPRRKSKVSGAVHSDRQETSGDDNPPAAIGRGRGQRRGSDRARGSSRGRGRGQGRGRGSASARPDTTNLTVQKVSKPSRVKITPRQGNPLQLRVTSPRDSASNIQSTSQRRKKIIPDSDEECHLDNARDDDWTPDANREGSNDEDEELNQPNESNKAPRKSKQSNQPTRSNDANRRNTPVNFSGDTASSRRKGKGRATNQDAVSGDDEEADILQRWKDHDLMGDTSPLARPASPIIPDLDDPSSSVPFGSHATEEMRILCKHLSVVSANTSTNITDIRRLNHRMDMLFDLVQRALSRESTARGSAPRGGRDASSARQSSDEEKDSPCPRTTPQRRYVRKLIRVLLGLKPDDKDAPHGATPAEKRNWNTDTITIQGLLADGPVDLQDTDNTVFTSGLAAHDKSPGSIKIIRDTLYQAGVAKFQPEWSEPMASVNNAHLCRVATAIFIKLVQSGEYSGVSKDVDPGQIYRVILNHLNDTWRRKFRENREWSQNRLQERHKTKVQNNRISKVREARSQFVMARPNLWALTPVVQACCSNDETDSEADQEQDRKICKIWRLPWRNPLLQKIFDDIDAARERNNPVNSSPGNQPRVRQRDPNYPVSKKTPPKGLNVDCYCPLWLDAVVGRRELLKVVEQPILAAVKKNLASDAAISQIGPELIVPGINGPASDSDHSEGGKQNLAKRVSSWSRSYKSTYTFTQVFSLLISHIMSHGKQPVFLCLCSKCIQESHPVDGIDQPGLLIPRITCQIHRAADQRASILASLQSRHRPMVTNDEEREDDHLMDVDDRDRQEPLNNPTEDNCMDIERTSSSNRRISQGFEGEPTNSAENIFDTTD
ncbi:uncharacterized protein MELLADRAFT_88679 [Melampsora larici-populina 98AG31]|uniref:Uncharacterized protein n=1 Tax=Melampsora larici-populina (strain 98AG31 / pathotype 3-4-7) TaxID=747676 RepID=F4RSK9_MELLP|nr:uncharacterized protein MELLADRAFT_88679 [Melampsora larici-populina 98AG31]EGG04618.1 hypothetical protein MELLADRAFT_88679 [Melampsora larici-populina 98AG31]